jgi:hypothetical protein
MASNIKVGTSNDQVVIFTDKAAYLYVDFNDVETLVADIRRAKSEALTERFLATHSKLEHKK